MDNDNLRAAKAIVSWGFTCFLIAAVAALIVYLTWDMWSL